MYFTIVLSGGIVKPSKGNTNFPIQNKEDKIMLKKLEMFLEEYYKECGHK